LIRRSITQEAHKIAIAIATFIISFLHFAAFWSSDQAAEIITPPANIPIKPAKIIIVTNILTNHHISIGKASSWSTTVWLGSFFTTLHFQFTHWYPLFGHLSSLQFFANSIQFPINGTLVLSLIPQQTSFSAQDLQTQSIFFVASGHSHTFVDSNQVHGVDQLRQRICALIWLTDGFCI
jgi:hypothetical protein